jgi:hypothetical protein
MINFINTILFITKKYKMKMKDKNYMIKKTNIFKIKVNNIIIIKNLISNYKK